MCLLHPKMLWLTVWPVIVALVIWVTLAVLYWGEAAQWIAVQLHQWPPYEWAASVWPLALVGHGLAGSCCCCSFP